MASLFRRLFSFLRNAPFIRALYSLLRWPFGRRESLSPHLQYLKDNAAEIFALCPMEDKYRPSFTPEDGAVVAVMITSGISYYFTTNAFIKRQPHPDELGLDLYGNPVVNPYIDSRLRNEAAALQFLSRHTTIPVPAFLGLWEEHGLLYLKTGMVHGAIELRNVDKDRIPAAVAAVTVQLETEILPQLKALRRNFIGSADPTLPVVVPHRLWAWKDKRVWPRLTSETDAYVFVHTDLDRQNILVHPVTFRIVCIIDWETAGFFPPDWELPKWTVEARSPEKREMDTAAIKRELDLFDFADTEQGLPT